MITATSQPSFDEMVETAATAIETQSIAANANAQLADDPVRWRVAQLVWPLFTASLLKQPAKPIPRVKG